MLPAAGLVLLAVCDDATAAAGSSVGPGAAATQINELSLAQASVQADRDGEAGGRGKSAPASWRDSTISAAGIVSLDGADWRVTGAGRSFSTNCTGGGPNPGNNDGCGTCEVGTNFTAPAVGPHGWYSVYTLPTESSRGRRSQNDCVELCAATAGCAAAVWTSLVHGRSAPGAGSGCGFRTAAEVAQGTLPSNGSTACLPNSLRSVSVNIPATVPGDLVSDLQRAGKVLDPLSSNNHRDPSQVQWWNGESYTYSKNFTVDESVRASASVRLILNSVKMGATVTLNGRVLGHTTNQFLRYSFEVGAMLLRSRNTISVRFDRSIDTGGRFMACSGGWDWAPYSRMRDSGGRAEWTRGLTGSVYLVATALNSVAIDALSPTILYKGEPPMVVLEDDGSHVFAVNVTTHLAAKSADGILTVVGSWGASKAIPVAVSPAAGGTKAVTVILEATGVKLWWPRGTVRSTAACTAVGTISIEQVSLTGCRCVCRVVSKSCTLSKLTLCRRLQQTLLTAQ
eukprot:SAG11_NODE_900_length_6632_cov_2.693403_8_plen_511_part_00